MRAVWIVTIFFGALLLFLVQPLVGRLLLPRLGGTPAVWNTCMMFFQALLLAGYAWAHLLSRWSIRAQVIGHVAALLVGVLTLPIALRVTGTPPTNGSPITWLLLALLGAVALPFFALSANAPLLQRWFAGTDDPRAGDPYFLYAASNAGSLVGLLGYPLLVEPLLALGAQRGTWIGGYAACALATVVCGVLVLRRGVARAAPDLAATPPTTAPARGAVARWVLLAFVPSSLMLGVTQHLTTDVAAVPFLWAAPLALYLVTFIIAFARRALADATMTTQLFLLITIPTMLMAPRWANFPIALILLLHLGILFSGALMCHCRLAAERPHPRYLTGFYLAVAAGGALGGIFNA
nr:hypothetical protein [Hydrogenophaga sp.]NIT07169.1 hypothetical protein [Xanthomonadales bacterium]NIN54059.1 hypothetical protein [Hydrogenophaga sp.]NIO50415.1 hypothetical protein [Hydrogenophaga sp.]NIO88448.1 hypothetical protein [Hydrogenophaga sp.]